MILPPSFEDLRDRFQAVARKLRKPQYADHCRTTLAHWTSINERGLPFALLNQTVGQIAADGFDAAAAVRGIGVRKLQVLVDILERVAEEKHFTLATVENAALPSRAVFAPSASSLRQTSREVLPIREVDWNAWRGEICRRPSIDDPIGRYVGTLRNLPRRDWFVPLKFYAGCNLNQLFGLRRYGIRRAAAVVDTFQRLAEPNESNNGARPVDVERFLAVLDARNGRRRTEARDDEWPYFHRQVRHDLGGGATHVCSSLINDGGASLRGGPARVWYYRRLLADFLRVRCPEVVDLIPAVLAKGKDLSPAGRGKLTRLHQLCHE